MHLELDQARRGLGPLDVGARREVGDDLADHAHLQRLVGVDGEAGADGEGIGVAERVLGAGDGDDVGVTTEHAAVALRGMIDAALGIGGLDLDRAGRSAELARVGNGADGRERVRADPEQGEGQRRRGTGHRSDAGSQRPLVIPGRGQVLARAPKRGVELLLLGEAGGRRRHHGALVQGIEQPVHLAAVPALLEVSPVQVRNGLSGAVAHDELGVLSALVAAVSRRVCLEGHGLSHCPRRTRALGASCERG